MKYFATDEITKFVSTYTVNVIQKDLGATFSDLGPIVQMPVSSTLG